MNIAVPLFLFVFGVAVGGCVGWALTWMHWKAKTANLTAKVAMADEKLDWVQQSEERLENTFSVLAVKALRRNDAIFAKAIDPRLDSHSRHFDDIRDRLQSDLSRLESHVREIEQRRSSAYSKLDTQIVQLERSHAAMRQATLDLERALKGETTRGHWGEFQLRRVIEMAGLVEHVTFCEQSADESGNRPDVTIHLPNEGNVAIDAKFPCHHYLEAMRSNDPRERAERLDSHAAAIRATVRELAKREYPKGIDPSPELTIMFVPIESSLVAAFQVDSEILEYALSQKVILASPITLFGYLKSIAYGWQEFTMSKNAREILRQGRTLYQRACKWFEHYRTVGLKIEQAAQAYNDSLGSMQYRFLPACRRFQELSAIADEIPEPGPITVSVGVPLEPTDDNRPAEG